jgi:hypothetical protein
MALRLKVGFGFRQSRAKISLRRSLMRGILLAQPE